MIKANELRIGNIIVLEGIDYDPEGNKFHDPLGDETIEVACIDTMTVWFGNREEAYLEYCSGIPLTEEWLLKFGFENPSEQYFSKGKCAVFQHKNGDFELTLGRGLSAPFKYVHQLQNLYFALTGTELEITGD